MAAFYCLIIFIKLTSSIVRLSSSDDVPFDDLTRDIVSLLSMDLTSLISVYADTVLFEFGLLFTCGAAITILLSFMCFMGGRPTGLLIGSPIITLFECGKAGGGKLSAKLFN